MIRLEPDEITDRKQKRWAVDGIVAYSKVCTHVGCPVGLYEQQTHHLLCPCHQSTFDVTKDCAVIFGPAARPLPQLPLAVDSRGLPGGQRRLPRAGRPQLLGTRGAIAWQLEQAAGKVANELDERFGSANFVKRSARKVFPDHWSFMLGEIALYSFIILLLTGTFLTLWFKPSQTEVIYNGSYIPLHGLKMSEAYASTLDISFDVRGGLIIRQIHHWAALIFVAAMIVHMCRVFFTGAFRKPRETNWIIGFILITSELHRGPRGLLAAGRPAVRHRPADHRGRAALAAGGGYLPVVLPVRRRVPGR